MKLTIWLMAFGLILAGCGQTRDESISPTTAMFRTNWKDGQRAKVTRELVALLKMGMAKEEVASILENPSRLSDEIRRDGDSEIWVFTINLGRILILTFEGDKLTQIDGG